MHLKTLTLRGFKSFASATTLNLEPGVTCVVGPNGSGKSNVVDALAWVMGEQGAKTLRGGKMEDVIFAGTSGRPPLGRAEVSLTIDNTDGALPIEYAEVTISRTLFRNGGSEYAINGSSCRLLDIQELLSDSGLGREMHVIVGQGQLDAVLRATPEERRGFIEEAAGVLKHRKRKEKALRKLDAMQGNLLRLTDLTAEIRRQLGPLGRQAEAARRAATVQADLRDAKSRLLADDLAQLTASLEQEMADESALRLRQAEAESALEAARTALRTAEAGLAAAGPAAAEASATWYALGSVRDRLEGTRTLAAERVRLLSVPVAHRQGQDPDELDAQAERARETEDELAAEVEDHQDALASSAEERAEAEADAAARERELAALVRGAADRREGLARLAGQVAAKQSRVDATRAEIARLEDSLAEVSTRETGATSELEALEAEVTDVEHGQEGLDAEHEEAVEALDAALARLRALEAEAAQAEQDRSTWAARSETLDLSLTRKDGAGAVLAADALEGVVGSVAALLTIEPGYADAVVAALGQLADAVAVDSTDAAVEVIRYLRTEDAGRASLVLGGGEAAPTTQDTTGATSHPRAVPDGAVLASSVVSVSSAVGPGLFSALDGVVVVDDLVQARRVLEVDPSWTVVTRAGDLLAADRAWGGSAAAPSLLHLQAALDEARAAEADASRRAAEATELRAVVEDEVRAAQERADLALDRLHASDAAHSAAAERLGQLGAAARSAAAEAHRTRERIDAAARTLEEDEMQLVELVERLEAAELDPQEAEDAIAAATQARDEAAAAATAARAAETEARLGLRTSEERARALSGRAQSLERAARAEREARAQAERREAARRRQVVVAEAVRDGATRGLGHCAVSVALATERRDEAEAERRTRDAEVVACRQRTEGLAEELRSITDVAHRDEVARAQQQLRVEALRQRAVDELGTDPDVLVEEFGPHRLVVDAETAMQQRAVLDAQQDARDEVGAADGRSTADDEPAATDDTDGRPAPATRTQARASDEGDVPVGRPYVRAEQEKRLRSAERAMAQLGRVNPLALEEFAALEERHTFLTEQLADLKRSRADLLEIVKEIDERVERVFTEAFHDTSAQFDEVFPRLFPGGEGRLVLTDPANMLTTGIEVEARPAGKKVKRLSLLSGGERSLTAVALLVSIFKARPSPFYVMDEVEAALDDTNLGRLLEIFVELQRDSQLIVITHQKRTMEIADALYGVTMRGDGVTTVISQRIREVVEQ
ncbi:chromosome segregation protein SMC [Sanguibacter inulinus]|uniref:Chromosome partition protein Smc n=1 Tax=Sanguibacter inulinus TaxID=60922 RepID=A0A853ERQ2_9MICO|nr:chromosome segregation protein SMC [Sanguibacter inulinus]MBF0722036.1 chromosome segregation protein SMC [Sanguibacter inulinus]NYS93181.1 chromosome segregation protein SMC [Sanguibacter inulinus]